MTALLLLALAASRPALAAECAVPSTNQHLLAALEEASSSFARLKIDAFKTATETAVGLVECLGEPISRPTAAEYHRVIGLERFLDTDVEGARRSFAAARSLEPDYAFPADLVPEGNPILEAYGAVDPQAGPFEELAAPAHGSLRLNGSRTNRRATSLPLVFQLLDDRGGLRTTHLVAGDASLPEYETAAEPDHTTETPPPEPENRPAGKARKGPRVALLVGAGVAAVAAGGVYGAALGAKGGFENTDDISSLDRRKGLANGLVVTSGGLGVAALALGTTAFVVNGRF